MKKQTVFYNVVGTILGFTGAFILMQGTDMNPMLLNDNYLVWFNTHFFGVLSPRCDIFLLLAIYLVGGIALHFSIKFFEHVEKAEDKQPCI